MVRIENDNNGLHTEVDIEVMIDNIDEIKKHFKGKAELMCYVTDDDMGCIDIEEVNCLDLWIQSKDSEKGATVFTNMTLGDAEVLANSILNMVKWKRKLIKEAYYGD